jgi:NAD(P)-dependent dehydrogenase (short-subunit alcohol dehydrogenase family)
VDTESLYPSIRPRYPELAGRVAVITGSNRGIGKGIAMRLARERMRVVINGRDVERTQAVANELHSMGAETLAVPGDIGQSKDVKRLFDEVIHTWGRVDILVNNAADLRRRKFFEADEALLDAELASNIRGPYICSYRAAEIMRSQNPPNGGSIIHISSVGGLRAHWRGLPYDVTKGALDAMTRAMALELAQFNIRVNAVAPGATLTEHSGPRVAEVSKLIPAGRFGTPLDIGAAVAFLASEDAAYILGQVIYVDGGMTVQLGTTEQPL